MKKLIFAALTVVSGSSMATGVGYNSHNHSSSSSAVNQSVVNSSPTAYGGAGGSGGMGVGIGLGGRGGQGGAGGKGGTGGAGGYSTSQGGAGGYSTSQGGSADNANNSNMSTNYSVERQVPMAYAPSIPPTVNCASSVGIGGAGASFGLSFGATPVNVECERRELARTAMNFGDRATAEEVLCGNADYNAARTRAGRPCAKDVEKKVVGYTGHDPIVIRRLRSE